MKASRRNVILAFLVLYVIWGSTYLAIKIAIETLPPFLMASTRFLVSGTLLYALARGRGAGRPSPEHWRSAAVVGTLLLLGGNGLVALGEKTIDTGIAAILVATAPIWMVLLNWALRGKKPGARVIAGLLTGFFGVWVLVRPGDTAFHWAGITAVLFASFFWAAGSVLSKSLRFPGSALLAVGMQMLCGGASLLIASALTREWNGFVLERVSVHSALALLYLILIGSGLGFTAYIWLLKVSTVSRVSTYAYVNPLVAVALGMFFLGEKLTPSTLVAGAVILAGVILIQSSGEVEVSPDN